MFSKNRWTSSVIQNTCPIALVCRFFLLMPSAIGDWSWSGVVLSSSTDSFAVLSSQKMDSTFALDKGCNICQSTILIYSGSLAGVAASLGMLCSAPFFEHSVLHWCSYCALFGSFVIHRYARSNEIKTTPLYSARHLKHVRSSVSPSNSKCITTATSSEAWSVFSPCGGASEFMVSGYRARRELKIRFPRGALVEIQASNQVYFHWRLVSYHKLYLLHTEINWYISQRRAF